MFYISYSGLNFLAAVGSQATQASQIQNGMFRGLLFLLCVLVMMVLLSITVTAIRPFRSRGTSIATILLYCATLVVLVVGLFSYRIYTNFADRSNAQISAPPATEQTTPPTESTPADTTPTETEPATEETEPAPTDPRLFFAPLSSAEEAAEQYGLTWEIFVDGEAVESYQRENPISFSLDDPYFSLPGVATFRGNYYRNDPTYGTPVVTEGTLTTVWSEPIGSLDDHGGCCWTGQPLVVQWDAETKAIMNLNEDKKAKEDLVEVIYATLDGFIHFYDLEDGTKTREPIYMGVNFKGAGALDPRGYPLLYVGSGYNTFGKPARMYIISLIDGSILYQAGNGDPQSLRTDWSAFDSSPLVHAETDTLIWPGENGILYTYRLNTQYDKAAGTITVAPDNVVKLRYTSDYSKSGRYLGFEASASIVGNYLYISENGGLFFCIDLNTMELVWAQDTLDDSNSSPVFEWNEDGTGAVYSAPSLHWTAYASKGTISIYKMDAATGEILWTYSKDCARDGNISGGVQCTPVLGREGSAIENMVIYAIASTPSFYRGVITALDKDTGEVIWEVSSGNYVWSSPLPIYAEDGRVYLLFTNASGYMHLLDAETGESINSIKLTGTTEASPVLYGNMLVIGTREKVYGLKLS